MRLGIKVYLGPMVPMLSLAVCAGVAGWQARSLEQLLLRTQGESRADYANLAEEMKLATVQVQQWLTDSSATGSSDGLKEAADYAEAFKHGMARFQSLYRSENNQRELQRLDELNQLFARYYDVGCRMARAYIEKGQAEGNKVMSEFDPLAEEIGKKTDVFRAQFNAEVASSNEAILRRCTTLKFATLGIAGVALLASLLLVALIVRSITRPLHAIIAELTQEGGSLRQSSDQIAASSQSLAGTASQQAAALEEVSSSIELMASQMRGTATGASKANERAQQARQCASGGHSTMGRLAQSMTAIQSSTNEIGAIIKAVEQIAFQTNLLALNASVEAARAGEHGRSFGVVADEVRSLAGGAAGAGDPSSRLIDAAINNAQAGSAVVEEVCQSLTAIVGEVAGVSDLMGGIAIACAEQSGAIEQVRSALSQMDQTTQHNAASAEESAGAAQELASCAAAVSSRVDELILMTHGSTAS